MKLLKEYIKLLSEDFGGFGGGDFGGPYGIDFTGGDQSKLAKVFLTPFTDVIDTASGKGKELSTKAQTVAKVTFETIATSLIPVLSSDFDEIFNAQEEQIQKLQSQYKDVYDRTWTAFKDNDVLSAAFMYAPASMITSTAARKAPIPILKTINVLAGGKLDGFIKKVHNRLKLGDEKKGLDVDSGPGLPESHSWSGVILTEKIDIGKVLSQKKIKNTIESNPVVRQMTSSTQKVVKSTLETLFDRLRKITSANSIDDIERLINDDLGAGKLAELPDEERRELEQILLKSAKEGAKSIYEKHIASVIKTAINSGVPDDHPFVVDHKIALNKIKSL